MQTRVLVAAVVVFISLLPVSGAAQSPAGEVTFEVPLNLTRLEPDITKVRVTCSITSRAIVTKGGDRPDQDTRGPNGDRRYRWAGQHNRGGRRRHPGRRTAEIRGRDRGLPVLDRRLQRRYARRGRQQLRQPRGGMYSLWRTRNRRFALRRRHRRRRWRSSSASSLGWRPRLSSSSELRDADAADHQRARHGVHQREPVQPETAELDLAEP